jgi:hypothetical protein
MSSWNQANRGEKLGLVRKNRKKISQIINDYLYLPFFLFIILWPEPYAMLRDVIFCKSITITSVMKHPIMS